MGLSSIVTHKSLQMSRAQIMQAEAAKIRPDVRMNPILLKPCGDSESEVIVNGVSRGKMDAIEYFRYKDELRPDIAAAYVSLASENDIIVIEGAGSPAEINLNHNDIVNMGMAELAYAPVILVGDIDRGGVFAALAGTMLLLTERERELVKGVIINKFRGNLDLLASGLKQLEEIIHRPVLGVVPMLNVQIEDEDSLSASNNMKIKTDKQDTPEFREAQYDKLAASLRSALDMSKIYDILNKGI
jgi:adenosylcobyric acid synthase